MIKRLFLLACILICSQVVHASYFCPRGEALISSKATIDEVKTNCGTPDTEKTTKVKPQGPQELKYYVPQSTDITSMEIDVVILDDQVINIAVNGAGVSDTEICGQSIQTGYTKKQITDACGESKFVTDYPPSDPTKKEKTVTELTYKTSPPVTFVFEDGILTERR